MDTETRQATTALRERPQADVLIIGGGINGVATFRDLALQGVDVALVERSDFLSGASAASSHMIHGGIRYLENGELRLVHEAVTERNDLLTTAAHYVRPLRTTVPIFSTYVQHPFADDRPHRSTRMWSSSSTSVSMIESEITRLCVPSMSIAIVHGSR